MQTLYTVNRLKYGRRFGSKVKLTRVENPVDAMRCGAIIENQSEGKTQWIFVGQVKHDHAFLDDISSTNGIDIIILRELTGIDVTTMEQAA